MANEYASETWVNVEFDFEYVGDNRLEVSNYGRVKAFNKKTKGAIIKGGLINGYPIIRCQFFTEQDPEVAKNINFMKEQVNKLSQRLKQMKMEGGHTDQAIEETEELLWGLKERLHKKVDVDKKSRSIYYQSLVHRLVATYFVKQPSAEHSVVAHLDHDKLNNRAGNLAWMTPEENYSHQQTSPSVIKEKKNKQQRREDGKGSTKLTVTKVMLLKKLLLEGKPMKFLVKQFKVSDTQILRIKRGENWADVEPAK